MAETTLLFDELKTPIGQLFLGVTEAGVLRRLGGRDWNDDAAVWESKGRRSKDPFGFTTKLRAYFEGELGAIEGLATAGEGTDFQRRVWRALCDIPAGTTCSYGELAKRVGTPKACRAVGAANGANPIGIVVPCHRVIGANGTLTGYGGGLDRKRWLLAHETRFAPRSLFAAPGQARGA